MRFGVVTFVWASPFATSELGVLARIKAAGLDGAEIAVEEPGLLDLGELRAELDEHGLAASVLGSGAPGRDISRGDPNERFDVAAVLRRPRRIRAPGLAHLRSLHD